jgi:uncharacterized repeat protein (TIGR02543 family)
LFLILALLGAGPGTAAAATGSASSGVTPAFSDVSQSDPNLLYINYLVSRNMVAGFPDGTFHPDSGLTRAEAATLLVKVAGLQPASGPIPFSDVPASNWAYGNIAAAATAGLVHGYPDGAFRPDAVLTRAEGISLFTNLIKQPNEATLPPLSDLAPDNWAAGAVALALAADMVQTTAPGQFSPNDPLTRSDLARALGVILTENPDYDRVPLTGTLTLLTGTVTLAASGSTTPTTVTAATPVAAGDTITTAANSSAEIDFPDGSSLLLQENTIITVKKMQGQSRIGPDGAAAIAINWLEVGLTQGQMFGALASRYESQDFAFPISNQAINLADDETDTSANSSLPWYQASTGEQVVVQVDMPWGVAGMEGTFWHITVSPQEITESTADGVVQFTSDNGQSVQVLAGFQASLTGPGAAPTTPIAMTSQELSDWQSVLAWINQTVGLIQDQINPHSDAMATAILGHLTSIIGGAAPAPGNGYTVSYAANGATTGSVPTGSNSYAASATVTVPGNTGGLAEAGYTFGGWNTAANYSGATYQPGNTFTMGSANVTLYAVWTAIPTYTVTYNGNGSAEGTVPTDSNTYDPGATATVLGNTGNLVRTGYTFAGWNTAADGSGTSYNAGSTILMSSSVTLYAQWTLNLILTPPIIGPIKGLGAATYTVTYDGNASTGGSVPSDSNRYAAGATVTVLGNTGGLAKKEYRFAAWNTAANGIGATYQPGNTFTMGSANVTLYAMWRIT